jgi:non-specific serine/threonine protein kinase
VLALLALLFIGVFEFGQEGQVGRMLDALGINRGPAVGDSAAVSASAVDPAAPAPPPMAADATSTKPMPAEPTVTNSPASPTPASPASAPIVADAGAAKAVPTEPTAAGLPAGANPPAPLDSSNRTMPSAAASTASAERAAIAQPPAALPPSPTPSAEQQVSRAPASPRDACGQRTQFSLYRCMKMQCAQHRWTSHAQCKRLRITDSVD